ncbi:MAG: hypothetical protein KIS73_20440 [Enhydrobacter sp.]|nr:hypothetical protein [Enhydrobacter sp.]
MPSMDWDAFCDAHHRPFMISAQVKQERAISFAALRRFIESLKLKGNFALCLAGDTLRAAFESEDEAMRTARILGARKLGRGQEWAGEWKFAMNRKTTAKITSADRAPRRTEKINDPRERDQGPN